MSIPPTSTLQTLPDEEIQRVLGLLFEPSPALASLLLPQIRSTQLSTYSDLANLARSSLQALPPDSPVLLEILSAHPRLGAKKVDSAQSQSEQNSLGSEAERAQLQKLNDEYEATFPGLRYVVFVNGRSREIIMEDMRERIKNGTRVGEIRIASQAMCEIAIDRASKLGAK